MANNELPSRGDANSIGVRFRELFGENEFFLFPLDWGSARVADLIDEEKNNLGLRYTRYDLPINFSTNGTYRKVTKSGVTVRRDLEGGRTFYNTTNGSLYVDIPPIDFTDERCAVMMDDWLGFTGHGLYGGVIWAILNRGQDRLNLKKIYPAVMKAHTDFNLPPAYDRQKNLVGGLILPYEPYPLVKSVGRALSGAHD